MGGLVFFPFRGSAFRGPKGRTFFILRVLAMGTKDCPVCGVDVEDSNYRKHLLKCRKKQIIRARAQEKKDRKDAANK